MTWDPFAVSSTANAYSSELVFVDVSFQPSIAKDTTIIIFDDVSTSETFQVWNDGGRTLDYDVSISQGSDYFSVLPTTGTSNDPSEQITHTVTLNQAAIPLGQQVFGRVEISANGADDGPQYIDLIAGAGTTDLNPVGTWQGYDGFGEAINIVLQNDGTINGTWEEDLSPDCIIYWDLSGTYSFDPSDGHLTFCFDDRKPCAYGYELRVVVCIDGYMTACDYMSGTSSGTGYLYDDNGSLVLEEPLDPTPWTIWRVSTPYAATNPGPVNGTVNQSIDVDLTWSNGGGACNYDIYFGTDPTPDSDEFKGNISVPSYDPWTLEYDTVYYWRSDSINTNGKTTGTVQQFTTEPKPLSIDKDKTSIDFGIESTSEIFWVWNDGTGTLNYNISVSEGGSYFSISPPASGSSTGPSDTNVHTIMLNRENIYPGESVSGKVMISAAGADDSPQYIDLSATDVFPDLNGDWIIDIDDFRMFSYCWMDQMCSDPNWCEGRDFNKSGRVDNADFLFIYTDWLVEIADPLLVAEWYMDDNSDDMIVLDRSINGHHGTAQQNTSILHTTGVIGGALTFDGSSDYITIPDSTDWDIGTDFTVNLWVKHDDHTGDEYYLGQRQDGNNYWFVDHKEGLGLRFQFKSAGVTKLTGFGGEITDSNWHHIAVCKIGNICAIYKDGIQINYLDDTITGSFSSDLFIGYIGVNGTHFAGSLDEIFINHSNIFLANPNPSMTDTIGIPPVP